MGWGGVVMGRGAGLDAAEVIGGILVWFGAVYFFDAVVEVLLREGGEFGS